MEASTATVDQTTGAVTLNELYDVHTDSATDGQFEVLSATDLPNVSSLHWSYPLATLRFYNSVQRVALDHWTVGLQYSNEKSDKGATPEDPLSWTIKWNLSFDTILEDLEEDAQKTNPKVEVKNTAGDVFDPSPTKRKRTAVLSIQRNLSSLSLGLVRAAIDTVNDGLFLDQPAKQVLCRDISANGPHFYEDTVYAEVTFQFEMDRDSHLVKLLSQGYNQLVRYRDRRTSTRTAH
jgi:hypothetical protein